MSETKNSFFANTVIVTAGASVFGAMVTAAISFAQVWKDERSEHFQHLNQITKLVGEGNLVKRRSIARFYANLSKNDDERCKWLAYIKSIQREIQDVILNQLRIRKDIQSVIETRRAIQEEASECEGAGLTNEYAFYCKPIQAQLDLIDENLKDLSNAKSYRIRELGFLDFSSQAQILESYGSSAKKSREPDYDAYVNFVEGQKSELAKANTGLQNPIVQGDNQFSLLQILKDSDEDLHERLGRKCIGRMISSGRGRGPRRYPP